MATQQEAQQFREGDVVVFSDYMTEDMSEDEKVLKPGQKVMIDGFQDDGGFVVYPVDEKTNQIIDGAEGGIIYDVEIKGLAPLKETKPKAQAADKTPEKAKADTDADTSAEADEISKASNSQTVKEIDEHYQNLLKLDGFEEIDGYSGLKKADKVKAINKAITKAQKSTAKAKPVQKKSETQSAKSTATQQQEEMLPVHSDTKSVRSILEDRDALDAAKTLVEQVEQTYFTLGGVLAHIYREGIHKSQGFEGKRGFANYVEEELGLQYRKAMYLMNIYTQFQKAEISEEMLSGIGWSKAKELARIPVDKLKDDWETVSDFAKNNPRATVQDYVKTEYQVAQHSEGSQTRVKRTTFRFSLIEDEGKTVRDAIEAAKKETDEGDENQALLKICAEWALLSADVDIGIEAAIEAVESKYGVKLAVSEEAATEDQPEQADQSGEAEQAKQTA